MLSRLISIAGCALLAASALQCISAVAAEPEKLPQQVVDYILDLESDSYQKRETATKALPEYGELVIEPLLKVTRGDSLEASVRAILVIEQVYVTGKEASVTKAEEALESLTGSANPSVALRAEEAIDRHSDIREKRAIREIRKRGGTIKLWTAEEIAKYPQNENNAPGRVRYVALGARWSGAELGLRFIKRIRKFDTFYLIKGHPLNELALDDLRKAIPSTRFQARDSDAMLGISSGDVSGRDGCLVGDVSEGLAAQKAGIRSGDLIVKFDGKDVESFQGLVDLIGKKSAGDTVDVELKRNDKLMTLKVTLSSWLDK
ncbi:PDZ domain-containing protein [uncultured Gimesia sp.]|uniref:PDZ domain-containing protein n=1 Tax=uncultured Gimesia sp. TaxID=1678688 RepID=UPI0030D6D2FD|tara:strand:+ start:144785 stop:145738 length:954 start_codon:yes stop_codon:yes gene_type:complete